MNYGCRGRQEFVWATAQNDMNNFEYRYELWVPRPAGVCVGAGVVFAVLGDGAVLHLLHHHRVLAPHPRHRHHHPQDLLHPRLRLPRPQCAHNRCYFCYDYIIIIGIIFILLSLSLFNLRDTTFIIIIIIDDDDLKVITIISCPANRLNGKLSIGRLFSS